MKYISKSLTNVGKVRSANEDNLGEAQTPNGHLFVVCDGMGGHVGGAQASLIAVNSIIEYFQREVYDNVIQAIDHALSFANEQIYASALSNPELKGMGTTSVILLIRGEECFVGHVGDSRIYLLSDGKLNRITKDHSFVQTLVDSGIIEDEDAENHPNKNQILQALGIASSVKGTISQTPILPKAGDMFLLCSDGLNGMVKDKDIEKIMQENNLQVTAENLITAALNGGGLDNITASLVLIEESAHSSSRFTHFNPLPKKKSVDFTSTQQFGENKAKAKKISIVPYLVGILFILFLTITFFMLSGKEKNNISKKTELLSKTEIETYVCQNVNDILNSKVDFNEDTVYNEQCENLKHIIIIRDSLIKEIKTESISNKIEPINNTSEEQNKNTEPQKLKSIQKYSKNEISKLKINDKVKEEKGVFELHGFKIEVDKHKVIEKKNIESSKNKLEIHTVLTNETLSSIVGVFVNKCPNLSVDKLIDHNLVSPNFKGDTKKLEKSIIDKGWKLEIPCD